MGKNRYKPVRKSKSHNRKQKSFSTTPNNNTLANKQTIWRKILFFFKKGYGVFAVIATFIAVWGLKDIIHKSITPADQLYEEENTIKGIFIPDYILKSTKEIKIGYGTFSVAYPIEKFRQGFNVSLNGFKSKDGEPMPNMNLVIVNNRLYVSTEIRDLKTEEIIGIIDYKHWSLIKNKFLTWYEDGDTSLEVIDRYNDVVFSMIYERPNMISIQGYFVQNKIIVIVGDEFSFEYKNNIEAAFEKIKKIRKIHHYRD